MNVYENLKKAGIELPEKLAVQLSSSVRLLVIAAVIFVLLKAGVGEPVPMILPLLFTRVGTMALSRATKTKESKQ